MKCQRIPPRFTLSGSPQTCPHTRGAALLTSDNGGGIQGPGYNGLSIVLKASEILNCCCLGFQFQHDPVLSSKVGNQASRKFCPWLPYQAVSELACANPVKWRFPVSSKIVQFLKEPLLIHKILQDRRVKVCLQYAVGTVHGAVGSDMKDLVAATDIGFSTRTFFQE